MRKRVASPAWIGILFIGAAAPTAARDAQPMTHEDARTHIQSMQVRSPYKMSAGALAGTIRYQVRLANGQEWLWPQTSEQRVEQIDGVTTLTVCDSCGEEAPPSTETLRQYTRANPWVDSDARQVIVFARSAARGKNVDRQMRDLTMAVRKHMNGDFDFRRYDRASTAWQTRSGDCTEFAVLLAATARARGIPARLAYGVAYSSRFTGQSHVFSPHVWVQAWNGQRWTSYDAGLAGFDTGHIALAIGDGSLGGMSETVRAIQQLQIIDAAQVVPTRQERAELDAG